MKITEDDVTWNEKKATAFVKGSKNAICPTCGSEFSSTCAGFYNVPVDYDLNDAVGEFRLFASSDSKNYVLKSAVISRTNGFFDADAYTMQYQDGYVTGTAGTLTSDLKITHVEGFTAISGSETKISDDRAFVVTDGSNWYYISQAAVADTGIAVGDYVFGELNGVTGTVEGDDLDFTGATVKTISKVTKSEHVHSFELMKGLGAVVSSGHYLECACGLKYVLQSHDDGCDTCGYTNKWINVTVDNTEDVFVMPLTQGLYVAGPSTSGTASYTYTCFNGKTITYKSVTATNSDEDLSKNGTYYGTAGATLEIALGK